MVDILLEICEQNKFICMETHSDTVFTCKPIHTKPTNTDCVFSFQNCVQYCLLNMGYNSMRHLSLGCPLGMRG